MGRRSSWILGRGLDFIFILNFGWLIPLAIYAHYHLEANTLVWIILLVLYPIIRDAHSLTPIFMAAGSKDIRNHIRSNRALKVSFWLITISPILIITLSWCVPWHEVWSAGAIWNPISGLAILYVLASTWHISRQNYGVLAIYRRKLTVENDFRSRTDLVFCDTIFFYLSIVALFLSGERLGVFGQFIGNEIVSGVVAQAVVLSLSLGFALVCIFIDTLNGGVNGPRTIFFLSSAFLPAMLLENYLLTYFGVLFLNHCLVELGLGGRLMWARPNRIFWIALVMLSGVVVYKVSSYEGLLHRMMDLRVEKLYGGSLTVTNVLVGLFLGALYSLNILHFFADRLVYKLQRAPHAQSLKEILVGAPLG